MAPSVAVEQLEVHSGIIFKSICLILDLIGLIMSSVLKQDFAILCQNVGQVNGF